MKPQTAAAKFRHRILLATCLVLSAITQPASALKPINPRNESCRQLLSDYAYRQGITSSEYPKLYARLLPTKSFTRFLRQNPQTKIPETIEEYRDVLLKYFVEYSTRFEESPAIERLRNRSLARSLKYRGHAITAEGPRARFRSISRANLDRILKDYPYDSTPEMKPFEEAVDRLTPLHVHNSLNIKNEIVLPLLSFDRLANLGMGTAGFLSDSWFNREFLRTTDDVFFHVQFGRVEQNESTRTYGDHQLLLDSDFADQYGVVSPFVMYPQNLLKFAKVNSPEDYEIVKRDLLALNPDEKDELKILQKLHDQNKETEFLLKNLQPWIRMKAKLAAFDFTRPDFQRLIRRILLSRLQKIRTEQPERFAQLTRSLEEYSVGYETKRLIQSLVLNPLGFASGFELRLPVSVPPEVLHENRIHE